MTDYFLYFKLMEPFKRGKEMQKTVCIYQYLNKTVLGN